MTFQPHVIAFTVVDLPDDKRICAPGQQTHWAVVISEETGRLLIGTVEHDSDTAVFLSDVLKLHPHTGGRIALRWIDFQGETITTKVGTPMDVRDELVQLASEIYGPHPLEEAIIFLQDMADMPSHA